MINKRIIMIKFIFLLFFILLMGISLAIDSAQPSYATEEIILDSHLRLFGQQTMKFFNLSEVQIKKLFMPQHNVLLENNFSRNFQSFLNDPYQENKKLGIGYDSFNSRVWGFNTLSNKSNNDRLKQGIDAAHVIRFSIKLPN